MTPKKQTHPKKHHCQNSNSSAPSVSSAPSAPSTIDKIRQIVNWAEQFMIPSSNVPISKIPISKLHFLLNNARLAIKHRPNNFLSEPAFVELIDYLREINKDNGSNSNSSRAASSKSNNGSKGNSRDSGSDVAKAAANKNKHTFKITASYPADALEDKKKLALLPFPVTIEFRPDIYPDGDILFFGDWFRVKDQAEAFEVAEEVEKFVRELIEALNLMPMKSD